MYKLLLSECLKTYYNYITTSNKDKDKDKDILFQV